MKTLNPIHKIVARELALGFDLAEVCRVRKLDFDSWKRITTGSVFKVELERISKEIEEKIIQDAAEDPVLQTLKVGARTAATTLIEEMTNHDKECDGATSSTRIAASKTVLEMTGFGRKEEQKIPTVVINISGSKAASMKLAETLPPQPTDVIGVAYAG